MNLFQILITLFILVLLLLINRSRLILIERFILIAILLGGVYFVFSPQSAQKIAELLGIGRGADLVFYLFIIFSLFYFTSISTKMRQQDRVLTQIVRANAIANPLYGKELPPKK